MEFWTLFEVASMPILQMLLISVLGALMATNYFNILHSDTRKSLNKVRFFSQVYYKIYVNITCKIVHAPLETI